MGYEKYYKIVAAWKEPGSGEGGHAAWITVATSGRVGSISMLTTRVLHKGSVEGGSAVEPSRTLSPAPHWGSVCFNPTTTLPPTLNWEPGCTHGLCLLKGLFFSAAQINQ